MIPKIIGPNAYDFDGPKLSAVRFHSRGVDSHSLSKIANETGSRLFEREVSEMKPKDDHTVIHVLAVGDQEAYGDNRNHDGFSGKDNKTCHTRFKSDGHVFKDHRNWDPDLSTGEVLATGYNEKMQRIELLIALLNEKYEDELEEFESGGDIPVSMGSLQEYDVCSLCQHKAPTANDHCDHIKHMLGEVTSDGKKIFMENPNPGYFDISTVWKPADRIGYAIRKVATDTGNVPGHELAALYNMDRLSNPKLATLRRLAMMEKQLEGVGQAVEVDDLTDDTIKTLKTAVAAYGVEPVLDHLHRSQLMLSPRDFTQVVVQTKQAMDQAYLPGGFTRQLSDPQTVSSMDGRQGATSVALQPHLSQALRKAAGMRPQDLRRRVLSSPVWAPKTAAVQVIEDATASRGLAELYLHYKLAFASHPTNRTDSALLRAVALSNALPA